MKIIKNEIYEELIIRQKHARYQQKKINIETRRISAFFVAIPEEVQNFAMDLIERAAFMLVTLKDLEKDINENGTVELFVQNSISKYDRERPAIKIYNVAIKNYSQVMKQLLELLPEERQTEAKDELMEFLGK